MTPFDRAFAIVVGVEGGYVNDPNDRGGETKYGISKRAYPDLDIADLSLNRAKAIYQADYWDRAGCEALPWPFSLYVFDCAVNQGVPTARDLLRQTHSPEFFMLLRQKRYQHTHGAERYLTGWLNRLASVKAAGSRDTA